jgi:hypothetical protein
VGLLVCLLVEEVQVCCQLELRLSSGVCQAAMVDWEVKLLVPAQPWF